MLLVSCPSVPPYPPKRRKRPSWDRVRKPACVPGGAQTSGAWLPTHLVGIGIDCTTGAGVDPPQYVAMELVEYSSKKTVWPQFVTGCVPSPKRTTTMLPGVRALANTLVPNANAASTITRLNILFISLPSSFPVATLVVSFVKS